MTSRIIELRGNIVRSAAFGQYQDADDMLTAFADKIRAEAAEKVKKLRDEIADKYNSNYHLSMERAYDDAIDAITGKEPMK